MPFPETAAPQAAEEGRLQSTEHDAPTILTLREVAQILRCSKAHVANVINGRVKGLPQLAHLSIGRRKLVRREWLEQWMEANKTRC